MPTTTSWCGPGRGGIGASSGSCPPVPGRRRRGTVRGRRRHTTWNRAGPAGCVHARGCRRRRGRRPWTPRRAGRRGCRASTASRPAEASSVAPARSAPSSTIDFAACSQRGLDLGEVHRRDRGVAARLPLCTMVRCLPCWRAVSAAHSSATCDAAANRRSRRRCRAWSVPGRSCEHLSLGPRRASAPAASIVSPRPSGRVGLCDHSDRSQESPRAYAAGPGRATRPGGHARWVSRRP